MRASMALISIGGFVIGAMCGGALVISREAYSRHDIGPTLIDSYSKMDQGGARAAAAGDRKASALLINKLSDQCESKVKDATKFADCQRELYNWALIDAENGGSGGASIVYLRLSQNDDCLSLERARYWISRMRSISGDGGEGTLELVDNKLKSCKR